MKNILNPSGLTQRWHTDKCARARNGHGIGCVCAVGTACRKTLVLGAMLKSKEWKGSVVEGVTYKGRPANRLMHPSGAITYLFADVAP